MSGEEIEPVPLSFLPPRVRTSMLPGDPSGDASGGAGPSAPPTSGVRLTGGYDLGDPTGELRGPEHVLVVKVLKDPAELVSAFHLRYDVYESLNYLQQKSRARLEIDEYDWYSIPFGAFSASTGELLGTLRLITDRLQTHYVHEIQRILSDSGDARLAAFASKRRPHPMPSITSTQVAEMLDRFNVDQQRVYELSRTIVRPSHRGRGVSRGLMEFGLACALSRGAPILIGACIPQHVPMYAKYGYVKLPGSTIDLNDTVGQLANTVVCNTKVLPEPTDARVARLLRGVSEGATTCLLDLSVESVECYRFVEHEASQGGLEVVGA